MSNLFILENVDESTKAKLTRIFKGMRQVDVAAAAHVDIVDVTGLEKGRFVLPTHKNRILKVLGLIEDENT
jgi:hypothetical protein